MVHQTSPETSATSASVPMEGSTGMRGLPRAYSSTVKNRRQSGSGDTLLRSASWPSE